VDALTLRAPIAGVVQTGGTASAVGSGDPLGDLLGAVSGGQPASTGGAAPVAGVDDLLIVGDPVAAGTAIVTIVDISELGLVGEVDETDVLLVRPGVKAVVELDAAPGARYDATVGSVDLLPTASARGGVAYRIRLSLDGGEAAGGDGAAPTPRPGMSAVAHLQVKTAANAVSVPAAAIFTSELGDTVWVIRDGKAVRQQVRLGVQGEDRVQVVAGLEPDQTVVVTGADRVTSGQQVS
jgi:RND family efflux transporter MFP subunit